MKYSSLISLPLTRPLCQAAYGADPDLAMKRVKNLLAGLPPLNIPELSVSLFEFTLFPKLPDDIRLRIWDFVASEPRYIKLIELDRRMPAFYQTWDSCVASQLKNPGMLSACRESRTHSARHYKRCIEIAQRSPEDEHKIWTGNKNELRDAKQEAVTTNGTMIYVNFSRDIFMISKFPATENERKPRHLFDYNLKPRHIQYVQRIQQVYDENIGTSFPTMMIMSGRIRDYGLVFDEESKNYIGKLRGLDAEIHLRKFRNMVMQALMLWLFKLPLRVPIEDWSVELR